jgi:hypothetical protein
MVIPHYGIPHDIVARTRDKQKKPAECRLVGALVGTQCSTAPSAAAESIANASDDQNATVSMRRTRRRRNSATGQA